MPDPSSCHRISQLQLSTNILTSLLLLVTLTYTFQMAYAMGTTSLLNDEFFSTEKFTSVGSFYTLTHYPAANNHVFYNFLRSLFPGADSYLPAQARWLSFVFLTVFFAVIIAYFARRKMWFEGVIATFPFLNSMLFLDLGLQARGFGLVFALTAIAAVSTIRFEATRETKWLIVLGVSVFLSSWTIPSAVMLGGTMIIFLLPLAWKRTLIVGASTVFAIVLVYSPILPDVIKEASTYDYGEYDKISAPLQTVAQYWFVRDFESDSILISITTAAVVILPLSLAGIRWKKHRVSLILTGSAVTIFTVFVIMTTPIHRAACYLLIPVAISFALSLGKSWTGSIRGESIRLATAAIALCIAVPMIWSKAKAFHYVPPENYLEPARFIQKFFPSDHQIAALSPVTAPKNLDPHPERFVHEIDRDLFLAGKQAILDNRRRITAEERMPPSDLSDEAIAVDFQQVHIGFQRIIFLPPNGHGILNSELVQKAGTTSGRTWMLTCEIESEANTLCFHSPVLSRSKAPLFHYIADDGKKKKFPDPDVTFHDELVLLDLSALSDVSTLLIQLTTTEPKSGPDELRLQLWTQDFRGLDD